MRRQGLMAVTGVMLGLGTVTGSAVARVASGAHASKPTKPAVTERHFSATLAGARLSTAGNRFEDVFRIKRSPFGEGAMIFDGSLGGASFPVNGTATALTYDRGGKTFANDSFTLGTPNVDGVGTISGKGSCVRKDGTGRHLGETCTFTLKGSYDVATGATYLTEVGTYTLSPKATR